MSNSDTIAAIATPPGRGGVGIIRVSGKLSSQVAQQLLKTELKVRDATYLPFFDQQAQIVDQGIAIFLKRPTPLLAKTF